MTRRRTTAASFTLPGLEPERPKGEHIELKAPLRTKPIQEPLYAEVHWEGDELHIEYHEESWFLSRVEPTFGYVSEVRMARKKKSEYSSRDSETIVRVRSIIDAIRGSPEHAEYIAATEEFRTAPRVVVATFHGAEGDYSTTQCSISPDRLKAATKALDAAALKLGAISGDLSSIAIALSPAW